MKEKEYQMNKSKGENEYRWKIIYNDIDYRAKIKNKLKVKNCRKVRVKKR